jgi:leucyl-tRNA synthetase
VLNHIYSHKNAKGGKEYFWPHDVEHVHDEGGKITGAKLKVASGDLPAGSAITYEGVGTMSKSKNNGIDPQELIDKYGADTARLYTMFTAPPEATLEWNDGAVEGSYRFLRRVWAFGNKLETIKIVAPKAIAVAATGQIEPQRLSKAGKALRLEIHTVLKQVSYDYERMQYNTVVSGAMKLLNALEGFKGEEGTQHAAQGDMAALLEGFGILLRVLYPATPHISHALWQDIGFVEHLGDLLDASWPKVDEQALQQDEIELMLQINGKLRGSILVPAKADKSAIESLALMSEAFLKASAGAEAKKIIVVPGRLVNIVV